MPRADYGRFSGVPASRGAATFDRREVDDKIASVDTNDTIRSLRRQVTSSPLV
jgi:hypothetical protein